MESGLTPNPWSWKSRRMRVTLGVLATCAGLFALGQIGIVFTTDIDVQSGRIRERKIWLGMTYHHRVYDTEFSERVQRLGLAGSTEEWRRSTWQSDSPLGGIGFRCGAMGSAASKCKAAGDWLEALEVPDEGAKPFVERLLFLLQRERIQETLEEMDDVCNQVWDLGT